MLWGLTNSLGGRTGKMRKLIRRNGLTAKSYPRRNTWPSFCITCYNNAIGTLIIVTDVMRHVRIAIFADVATGIKRRGLWIPRVWRGWRCRNGRPINVVLRRARGPWLGHLAHGRALQLCNASFQLGLAGFQCGEAGGLGRFGFHVFRLTSAAGSCPHAGL